MFFSYINFNHHNFYDFVMLAFDIKKLLYLKLYFIQPAEGTMGLNMQFLCF